MARYGRRKNTAKTVEVIDETKFDFRQIWDDLYALDSKAKWKSAIPEQLKEDLEGETNPGLMYFYDLVLEKHELDVLTAMSEETGQDHLEDWPEEKQEQIMSLYNDVRAKSGLTELELDEAEFYIKRLSRYEQYAERMHELIGSILEGDQRENSALPTMLEEEIRKYAHVISDDIEKFNNNYENLTVQFNEQTGEYRVVQKKANERMQATAEQVEEAEGLLKTGFELLKEGAKGGAAAASKTGGWLKNTLFGKKKEEEADSRFDKHKEKVTALMHVFRDVKEELGTLDHQMKHIYEQKLKPTQRQAIILGQEYDKIILRYDEYIGALKEVQARFEDKDGGYIAVAKENATKGAIYRDSEEHVSRVYTEIKERIQELTTAKTKALRNVTVVASQIENVNDQMKRVHQFIERVPSYNMDLNTLVNQMDQLNSKSIVADGFDFDEKITGLIVGMFQTADDYDKELEEAFEDNSEHVRRSLESISAIREGKAERKLEAAKRVEGKTRELEGAIDEAQNREENIRKLRTLEGATGTGPSKGGKAAGKKTTGKPATDEEGKKPSLADKFDAKPNANDDKPEATSEEQEAAPKETKPKDAIESLKKRGGPKS